MKTTTKILLLLTVLSSACNRQDQKEHEHEKPNKNAIKFIMVSAMDNSMKEMHAIKQTGNPDYDFAAMMIPHHKGAVEMAEALLAGGKAEGLLDFGRSVIEVQQKEIGILNSFLKDAPQTPSEDAAAFKKAFNATMTPMMNAMSSYKTSGNMEKDFIALMIPHHQSAVDMAKAYLPYASNPDIKLLAEKIIKTQEEEIDWLKKSQ